MPFFWTAEIFKIHKTIFKFAILSHLPGDNLHQILWVHFGTKYTSIQYSYFHILPFEQISETCTTWPTVRDFGLASHSPTANLFSGSKPESWPFQMCQIYSSSNKLYMCSLQTCPISFPLYLNLHLKDLFFPLPKDSFLDAFFLKKVHNLSVFVIPILELDMR